MFYCIERFSHTDFLTKSMLLFYVQKLTDKSDYMYEIAKDTRKELAKFEAAFGAKYELGSDRLDDFHPLPGEETFAQKAKRRRSSLMLNRPLAVVDPVPLRQVSGNYDNVLLHLCPPSFLSHLTLPKDQRLFLKLGKILSIMAEASIYSSAPTRTCSGEFRVGFS